MNEPIADAVRGHPRRPHRALAPPRARRALPGGRRAAQRVAPGRRGRHGGDPRGR